MKRTARTTDSKWESELEMANPTYMPMLVFCDICHCHAELLNDKQLVTIVATGADGYLCLPCAIDAFD